MRTGIWLFRRDPSLVVCMPLMRDRSFSFLSLRSMDAGLTDLSSRHTCSFKEYSRTKKPMTPLSRGARSFPHWESKRSQISASTLTKALSYFSGLPVFFLPWAFLRLFASGLAVYLSGFPFEKVYRVFPKFVRRCAR